MSCSSPIVSFSLPFSAHIRTCAAAMRSFADNGSASRTSGPIRPVSTASKSPLCSARSCGVSVSSPLCRIRCASDIASAASPSPAPRRPATYGTFITIEVKYPTIPSYSASSLKKLTSLFSPKAALRRKGVITLCRYSSTNSPPFCPMFFSTIPANRCPRFPEASFPSTPSSFFPSVRESALPPNAFTPENPYCSAASLAAVSRA